MADLTVTVTESIILNNAKRGSTNTLTVSDITDTFERLVTCPHSQTTTIATFAAAVHTSSSAIDVDLVKYIRVTNLDENAEIELAVVGTSDNYQVTITAGNSHVLSQAAAILLGEEDTTPSFATMENLASLQVKPVGSSYNPQVELFVASA